MHARLGLAELLTALGRRQEAINTTVPCSS